MTDQQELGGLVEIEITESMIRAGGDAIRFELPAECSLQPDLLAFLALQAGLSAAQGDMALRVQSSISLRLE